jgi:hypothetical protein
MPNHLAISPSDGAILLIVVNPMVGGSVQENLTLSEVVVPAGTPAEQAAFLGSFAVGVDESELTAALLVLEERRHPEVKAAADAQVVADAALVTAQSNLTTAESTGDAATIATAQAAVDKATADKMAADKTFADADAAAKAADLPTPVVPPVEPEDATVAADQAALAADQAKLAADEATAATEDAAEAKPPVVP